MNVQVNICRTRRVLEVIGIVNTLQNSYKIINKTKKEKSFYRQKNLPIG